MATVHIVQGTHHSIPGKHLSAHATQASAVAAAMQSVATIMGRPVRADNWEAMIERFGEHHPGAAVWIEEIELQGVA